MRSVIVAAVLLWVCAVSGAATAQQLSHTWISASGSDAGPCTFVAPCERISAAYDKTLPGGEITCIGEVPINGGGGLTIQKSLTIDCTGTGSTVSTKDGTSFISITIETQASDTVILRGLNLNARRNFGGAVYFQGAGTLILERVRVTGAVGGNGSGLWFLPTGPGRLVVTNSSFHYNGGLAPPGDTFSYAGIYVVPRPGGTAQVLLSRVTSAYNIAGLVFDGRNSTGGINATISDSEISGNANAGILAFSPPGGAPIGVTVTRSRSTNNAFGVRSEGSNVTVRVRGSQVIGNGTGLSTASGGALLSAGANQIQANAANGGFTGPVATD